MTIRYSYPTAVRLILLPTGHRLYLSLNRLLQFLTFFCTCSLISRPIRRIKMLLEDSKLTVDALVDIETPHDVHLSSSGSKVVYSLSSSTKKLDKEFVSSLWVAEVGKEHSSRQLTAGLFNDKFPKWSPDEQSIAFISDRAAAGTSSAIYLISMKGGEAFPITKSENKKPISSFQWSPVCLLPF